MNKQLRPVLLRRQSQPAPSCGPGYAPRPPVTAPRPAAGTRPNLRFPWTVPVVLDWIADHPGLRIDINIPTSPRHDFDVGLRLPGHPLWIKFKVRCDQSEALVTQRLDGLVARLRVAAGSGRRR